ncbi:hypothetical protein M758_12G132300 [Ceratodon purpureus]|uniref:Uncharacterized protein n=1 Tax=Ceratodon purpureus TaxID=3225 RepID=A0A8T0GAA5_CERPU|nr:hypothetical protein KC19_12G129300 [Ceratodon purpureus]KAG0599161.1 hypothetical protein M758_12G132300 [Ceratodon purpureus]
MPTSTPTKWWSKDTVAVITGANQGIGYEIARQLAQNGLTVVATARSEERGKAAVEALRKELGGEAQELVAFHLLDVTSDESVAALAQWLRQTYRGVDILVNNAGIARAETEEKIFDTNYYGVKRVTKAILPLLRPSPAGARVINLTSDLGILKSLSDKYCVEWKDRDQITEDQIDHFIQQYLGESKEGTSKSEEWEDVYKVYFLTKVALNAYTSVLAREVGPAKEKVYVNCFNPGLTRTNMNDYLSTLQGNTFQINTLQEAAMTGIWLALHPVGGPHGKYLEQKNGSIAEW